MIFANKLIKVSKDGTRDVVELYEQPLRSHFVAYIYGCYVFNSYKLPGVHAFEKLQHRWHDRKCDDDCVEGLNALTDEPISMCTFIPWTNKQDLRYFELTQKNKITLCECSPSL